mmetsp:Transcript_17462/g.34895  ORF Transcript_17462/g.34895 Transcript_17462/m.34895 type:complete len:270 (-) Transcript_17462:1063-1872(-)
MHALERQVARQHLRQYHSEAVHIRSRLQRLVLGNFRRHPSVCPLAADGATRRQRCACVQSACDAKVRELGIAPLVNEDVGAFDVRVHDALAVQICQPLSQPPSDAVECIRLPRQPSAPHSAHHVHHLRHSCGVWFGTHHLRERLPQNAAPRAGALFDFFRVWQTALRNTEDVQQIAQGAKLHELHHQPHLVLLWSGHPHHLHYGAVPQRRVDFQLLHQLCDLRFIVLQIHLHNLHCHFALFLFPYQRCFLHLALCSLAQHFLLHLQQLI